jgi:hypothetical protein
MGWVVSVLVQAEQCWRAVPVGQADSEGRWMVPFLE